MGSLASVLTAFAWTGPSTAAPNGNTDAPLNTGTTDQIKNAGLSLNSFLVTGSGAVTGNFGVGVLSPVHKLDVGGDVYSSGNMFASGYFHTSDQSLKSAITTSPGLATIEQLRGVTFIWKKDGTPGSGVIAQEVEKVLPSAVHTDANGIKSVDSDQIIAALIESIKEQQVEIAQLKHEIQLIKAGN